MKAPSILVAAIGLAVSSLAQTPHADMAASFYAPDAIKWKDGPPSLPKGAQVAVLEGDPSKEGMFVMRIKFPNGYHIPAHTHPKPERVTVIQGTFHLAMGDNPKKEDAKTLTAGTYGVWSPGMVHAVWIEGETIVQLHGIGPWMINYVNPADDPRKK